MNINEICLGCKRLCKKLAHEDAKNCKDYNPKPVKKDNKKDDQRVIIKRR